MKNFLTIFQILLSVGIIILVFLQSNGESESRSNIMSSVKFEKRGWEKIMFYATLVILGLFVLSSLIQTLI